MNRDLQKRLAEHHSDVPIEIWSTVADSIPNYKKEKKIFFCILIGLVILTFTYLGTTNLQSTDSRKNQIISEAENYKHHNLISLKDRFIEEEIFSSRQLMVQVHNSRQVIAHSNYPDKAISPPLESDEHSVYIDDQHFDVPVSHKNEKPTGLPGKQIIDYSLTTTPISGLHKFNKIQPFLAEIVTPPLPTKCPIGAVKEFGTPELEIYSSLDYPFSHRSIKGNESLQDYIRLRNLSESPLPSYHFGIRIHQNISDQFFVKIGAEYSQLNEKFKYTDSSAVRVQTVIDSIFAMDGTLVDVSITTVTENGTRSVNHHNKLKYVSVPISIGYRSHIKRNQFYIYAGASFTLASTYSGKILSESSNIVTIGESGTAELRPYKTNIGIQALGGFGFTSPISEHMSLFVEPNFRYPIKTISNTGYNINQRHLTIGVGAGIKFQF